MAVGVLREEGLVVTIAGRGTFVKVPEPKASSPGYSPFVPRLAVPTGCQFQSRSGPH
jgi:hypothetical protein